MRAATQITIAIGLFITALVVLVASGWLIAKAWPSVSERMASQKVELPVAQSCSQIAKALELEISDGPEGSIIAGMKAMKDPAVDFGRASSMVAACRGYELASFCAGPGCAVGGGRELQFRLAKSKL